MSRMGDEEAKYRVQRVLNLTLVAIAGQVGCLTLVIIFAALFVGLWLDTRFDSRPLFTIILMLGSIPISVVLMFWIVRKTTSRLRSRANQESQTLLEEERERGETS